MTRVPVHHAGIWIALAGFVLFAFGLLNQIVWRGTMMSRTWPFKQVISNTLLGIGAALIVVGLVMR